MNRERLFACLGPVVYEALVDATALGRSKNHALIDVDHWLYCLLQRDASDICLLLRAVGTDPAAVLARLQSQFQRIRPSGEAVRDMSSVLEQSVAPAIAWSQIALRSQRVRSAHLVLSWLDEPATARWLVALDPVGLGRMSVDQVLQVLEQDGAQWPEGEGAVAAPVSQPGSAPSAAAGDSGDVLARWGTNLTEQASKGQLDPVVGRHEELRMVLDILLRRRQNNPILVGEAGVGKTAVVEALAQFLLHGDVPVSLKGAQVWALDIVRMQAGASARGEFEQRLRSVLDAVAASDKPLILFCDEAHTLIGAGGAAGTGDAVNLIKPMLARGQLRMIAATTWAEYKQFIEPDAALTRRFQPVPIEEPDDDTAIDMLRMLAPRFGSHHKVLISDAALKAAVKLTRRFLPSRQLPDKAISVLDTACARVSMSQVCAPAELDRIQYRIQTLEQKVTWRNSDARLGLTADASDDTQSLISAETSKKQQVEQDVQVQREAVRNWVNRLEQAQQDETPGTTQPWQSGSNEVCWVRPWVDDNSIAEVLSEWTGVPCNEMGKDQAERLASLEVLLKDRIHGQEPALSSIAQALKVAHAGLGDPNRPLGVMLLAGPTGTGKSQTAQALADLLFGGKGHLIHFNMNEFQEAHTVSTLKGAPPGYVGYGKGGRLTEALRKQPYAVLLLDEFDRAHPDVHEIFYQAFDQGWMEDAEGRHINLRNCLVLMTSNVGDAQIAAAVQAEADISQGRLNKMALEQLQKTFAPALLARMQVVAYRPLGQTALAGIAHQSLSDIDGRLKSKGVELRVDENVADWVASAVQSHPAAGRAVGDLLRQHVLPSVAQAALDAQAQGRTLEKVRLMAGRTLEIVFDAEVDGATPEPAPQVQAVAEGDAPSVSTSLSIEETPCV